MKITLLSALVGMVALVILVLMLSSRVTDLFNKNVTLVGENVILTAEVEVLKRANDLYHEALGQTTMATQRECVHAQVRFRNQFGAEIVVGDVPLCGSNLEWGTIEGPSKLKVPPSSYEITPENPEPKKPKPTKELIFQ